MKPNTDDWFEPALVLGMVALFGVAMLAELGQHSVAVQATQAVAPAQAAAHYAGTSKEARPRAHSVKES